MMKVFLLSISMIISGSPLALANKNPWMRACRIDQGQFWVLKAASEELAMCFFEDAGVGAETFFLFKTKAGMQDSLKAYKDRNMSSPRGGVCGSFGAELIQGKDTEGQTFNICRFEDQSLIEETTLWLGPGAGGSESLDRALSSTY
ncbi:hypothetical protein QJS83_11465 [Bdellovibrio sp. 22V]|uniref:hypothetical protein n=1 Tax=Bdellovibrio sp. 22V TaxID=3044166 RepID=UPI002543E3CF|nr:hypothetical protein [Bdellovibrio sp. 22V]WII71080.1 hypothetical protein QJS83_11465 [Bdellovibrio sp. 22V]